MKPDVNIKILGKIFGLVSRVSIPSLIHILEFCLFLARCNIRKIGEIMVVKPCAGFIDFG